jgi:drug/metabolite transporter (DMT)-like permease
VWGKHIGAKHHLDLLSLTTWQMLWGAIPLVVIALIVPENVQWNASFIASALFLGIVSQAVAWTLWLFNLSRLPTGVAAIASLATPIVGVAAATIRLHEIPSVTELAGLAFIVVALIVNALPSRRDQRKSILTRSSA